jgi:hypothetical protein
VYYGIVYTMEVEVRYWIDVYEFDYCSDQSRTRRERGGIVMGRTHGLWLVR